MGHSLCNKCSIRFSCCLNYDGKPCRENRDVEPTNYDKIMDMSMEELGCFLESVKDNPPWVDAFSRAKCDCGRHEYPHGSDIMWWLEQEAARNCRADRRADRRAAANGGRGGDEEEEKT